MQEEIYWVGFSVFPGIGPWRFQKLLQAFWTAENAWGATEAELKNSGIGERITEEFMAFRKKFSLPAVAEQLHKQKISYLTLANSNYPQLLAQIKTPPFVLFVKGERKVLFDEQATCVAVVGTRKITDYGRQVTQLITEELASAGCVIVSGLAMGVDAVAHSSALSMKGKTIAVLGSGVDTCTPRENINLYENILDQGGVIVSEVPPGQMPNKGSFPSRNRIIAGLSFGVVVTEGAEDSGSLITANDAFENGRKVFAVPGPITSSVSRGPIALISQGAQMITSAKDILDVLDIPSSRKSKKTIKGDSKEEEMILRLLENETLLFDELVRESGFHPAKVGTLISLMEMKGMIKSTESGGFGLKE